MVAGIAIGSIIGVIGAFIGAFELFSLWHNGRYFPSLYEDHPNLEVFGFLAIFILSAAFTIIPKFKNRKLFSTRFAWESIILISLGNLIVLLTGNQFLSMDDLLFLGEL